MRSFLVSFIVSNALIQAYKYRLVEQSKNYVHAQSYCKSEYGTDLASVHSDADNDAVKELCSQTASEVCWVGLNDIAQEGVFEWEDGTVFDYGSDTSGVYPWDASDGGEPNNSNGGEDCVMLRYIWNEVNDYRWNDGTCPDYAHFICNAYTLNPTPPPADVSSSDPTQSPTTNDPTQVPSNDPSAGPTGNPSEMPSDREPQTSALVVISTSIDDRTTADSDIDDQGGEGQVDEDGEEDGQGEGDGAQGDEERNSSMFGGAINSLGSIWMLAALGLALLCCLFCFLFILERRKTNKLKRELEQHEIVGSPSGPSPTTQGASTAVSSSPSPPPVPVAMVPPQNPLVVSMPMLVPVSSASHNAQQNIMMAPGSLSQHSGAGLSMEPAQSALPSSFLSFQRQQEVGEEADGGNEGVHNAPQQGGTLQMQQNADNDVDDIVNDEEDYDVDVDEVQMTAGGGVNTLGGDEYEYYDADIASDEFVVNDDDDGNNEAYGGTWTKS